MIKQTLIQPAHDFANHVTCDAINLYTKKAEIRQEWIKRRHNVKSELSLQPRYRLL